MNIVYFKIKESTFILKDQEILERNFQCRSYKINSRSPILYFLSIVKLIIFMLTMGWRYDAYYIRFADWHTAILTFFKTIYRKKLFVVIGGFDVAAIKLFNYGAHLSKLRSAFITYTLNNATCLLPNSESMIFYENTFIQNEAIFGGIKQFAPNTTSGIEVVPNGFNTKEFQKRKEIKKRNLAITVAVVNNDKNFFMKGIDKFIETAHLLPEYDFLIVGISKRYLQQKKLKLPNNLKTIEFTQLNDLVNLYSEAKVFCLFSLSEGMPNVLCEAMLCECIPVGTHVTSIPEIINDSGFVIPKRKVTEYVKNVKFAFTSDNNLGLKARQNIISNYNIRKREEKIVSIIQAH